jgi:hypothetical protein
MSRARLTRVIALGALALATIGGAAVAGQQPASRASTWQPAKTVDGHPDLQGVWSNDVITPLQRPAALKDRTHLTPDEVASLKARSAELFAGGGDAGFSDELFVALLNKAEKFRSSDAATGNYNHFWVAERTFDNRTSLITDPLDGRMPALTPEAAERQKQSFSRRLTRPADGPEDRGLTERCIHFGLPNTLAGYNANIQVLQSRDHVVVISEMIHDARIIPLDSRPHVGSGIRNWMGDSRGRWDGSTLVVETTNFVPNAFQGASDSLKLVERFTRVGADTLEYAFTVDDPKTWTKPWSAMIPYKKNEGRIYEYACHEGNHGMVGILSGHRAQERTAPKASQP